MRSGGVVVGGLGNGCSAEALGPCGGESALELFATSSNKLLQVTLGDRRPQIIDAARPVALTGHGHQQAASPMQEAGPAFLWGVLVTEGAREAAVVNLAAKSVNPDTAPSIAVWGRWGALVNGQSGAEVVRDVLNGRQLAAINRYYVIAPTLSAVVLEMPNAGVGQFKLMGHSGLLVDPASGLQETTASNGSLQIDFGARRFQTSLELQSPTVQTTIRSQGYIEASGKMASDPYVSATALEGLVGGKGGGEVIYIYHRPAAQGIEAFRRGVLEKIVTLFLRGDGLDSIAAQPGMVARAIAGLCRHRTDCLAVGPARMACGVGAGIPCQRPFELN